MFISRHMNRFATKAAACTTARVATLSTSSSSSSSAAAAAASIKGRSFLSLHDFSRQEINAILDIAVQLKDRMGKRREIYQPLTGRTMAMLFEKRSTRTRVSSETGMSQLGGHALFLGSADVQVGVNETVKDTARVLSRFNDIILARVNSHDTIEELARESSVPVINALSDLNHPLQILADVMTMREHFGSAEGLTVSWVGDGNNILHSLLAAAPKIGYNMRVACPKGFDPNPAILAKAVKEAGEYGTTVYTCHDPVDAVTGADVIVTDTWVSMGQEDEAKERLKAFEGYQVTMKMAEAAAPGWRFMHCLPRKPYEVDDEVFYSDRSIVWDEAENRKWTVMAVMLAQLQGGL